MNANVPTTAQEMDEISNRYHTQIDANLVIRMLYLPQATDQGKLGLRRWITCSAMKESPCAFDVPSGPANVCIHPPWKLARD